MKVVTTRVVLLLGRRPSIPWADVLTQLRKDDELFVLSLGYPVTRAQQAAFAQAETAAERAGAWFDALLVTSFREVLDTLRPDDRIHLSAGWLERRRLRQLLVGLRA